MKKKNLLVLIILVIILVVLFMLLKNNGVKKKEKETNTKKEETNEIVSKNSKLDKDLKEIICTKKTSKNINGEEKDFLNKIVYHIVYNKDDIVQKYYYQYYLVFENETDYQYNHDFIIDETESDPEYFDKKLTIIDNHYIQTDQNLVIENQDEIDPENTEVMAVQTRTVKYTEYLKELKELGYTCE